MSFNFFLFRLIPAFLFFPFLASAMTTHRICTACSRKGTCDKTCKRMYALATWRRKLARIPMRHSIPMHYFFHPRNGADDHWIAAAPSF